MERKCDFCGKTGFMLVGKPSLHFCDLYCQNEYYRRKVHKAFDGPIENLLDRIIKHKG